MTEEGYKGGLVSWVKNSHSGKKYLVSTAQEIGKDYWCTVIHPRVFFGLIPNVFTKIFTFARNNKNEARAIHRQVKEMVIDTPEKGWWEAIPSPVPPDGWSSDAQRVMNDRLKQQR